MWPAYALFAGHHFLNGTKCAVKHKVAVWTGYGCLPTGPHLSKIGAKLNSFSRSQRE
jgi:hypothetical protein